MKATHSKKQRLLVVDDDATLLELMQEVFEQAGYSVRTAGTGAEAERIVRRWHPNVVLLDLVLPDVDGLDLLKRLGRLDGATETVILSGRGSIRAAVDAVKSGAYSFVEKPAEPETLVAVVNRAAHKSRVVNENRQLRAAADGRLGLDQIVGASSGMREVIDVVKAVASSDASVLVHGESGTGKELIANAIHALSHRAQGPFVKINCAAVPKDLIESELFGYRRGAFTGATSSRDGVVAQAAGGSLLLDEIGEMPPALQTKLLRLLQEREFRPLGAERHRKADFRLICTTNLDVQAALETEQLRDDLYFRISTVSIRVPPLRDRVEDLVRLADFFLAKYRQRHRRAVERFTHGALDALRRHAWPGNVRELEAAVEHGVLLAKGAAIERDDLPEMVRAPRAWSTDFSMPADLTLAELEKQAILQTLERTGWNKQAAAQRLGLYRPTLYSKMRKHGILPASGRSRGGATGPRRAVEAS